MPARHRRDVDPRRPLHLHEVHLELALEVAAALLVDEVPLVVREHDGAAGVDDHLDDPGVLLGQRLPRVQQDDGHLGLLQRGLRPQRGVEVGAVGLVHPPADARRVDEPPGAGRRSSRPRRRGRGSCRRPRRRRPGPHPASALSRLDLPTFGRPTSATRRSPPASGSADRRDRRQHLEARRRAGRRSPGRGRPRPGTARPGRGSTAPTASASPRWSSTLFAASTTGLPERRSSRTTASSVSVAPTVASTTNSTASASSTAISACSATRAVEAAHVALPAAGVHDDERAGRPTPSRRSRGRGSPRARPGRRPRAARGSG